MTPDRGLKAAAGPHRAGRRLSLRLSPAGLGAGLLTPAGCWRQQFCAHWGDVSVSSGPGTCVAGRPGGPRSRRQDGSSEQHTSAEPRRSRAAGRGDGPSAVYEYGVLAQKHRRRLCAPLLAGVTQAGPGSAGAEPSKFPVSSPPEPCPGFPSTWPEGSRPRGGQPALCTALRTHPCPHSLQPCRLSPAWPGAAHAALTGILSCVCRAKENKETMTRALQAQGLAPWEQPATHPLGRACAALLTFLLGPSALRAAPWSSRPS